jgi:predicted secreted hydrolase
MALPMIWPCRRRGRWWRRGDGGYSVKSAGGQASHYYSQPFYTVTGRVTEGGREVAVTGQAWLDREWSSQPLAADQTGWDWFSLMFDDGARLMGFRLRDGGHRRRGHGLHQRDLDRARRHAPLPCPPARCA